MMDRFTSVICAQCRVQFFLPNDLAVNAKRDEHILFYCPHGHRQYFPPGETEEDKLRRERDRLKQQVSQIEDEAAWNLELAAYHERSASAYKGHLTRHKKRAKHGVCPCCHRRFQNVADHMKEKHPEFDPDENVIDFDLPKRRA